MRKLRYISEWVILYLVLGLFRLLPLDAASWLGGWLCRRIGPYLPTTHIARTNLKRAMPELTEAQVHSIIIDMWDNLGRVLAELPHFSTMSPDAFARRVHLTGGEYIDQLRDDDIGGFFVSGHFGNWELLGKVAWMRKLPLSLVYRPPNNPYVDKMLRKFRDNFQKEAINKGKAGARKILHTLKEHGHIGMLIDQKMNDGIPISFFGDTVMTAPAVASLALRHNVPIVPARIVREKGAYFRVTIFPPLTLPQSGNHEEDIKAVMTEINAMLESWIREHPAQWFWIHKRWPKESY